MQAMHDKEISNKILKMDSRKELITNCRPEYIFYLINFKNNGTYQLNIHTYKILH